MKKIFLLTFIIFTHFIGHTIEAEQKTTFHEVVLIPETMAEFKTQELLEQLKNDPKLKNKIEALEKSSKKQSYKK